MTTFKTTQGEFKKLIKESLNGLAVDGSAELKELIKQCVREVMMEGMQPQMMPQQQPMPSYNYNPYAQHNPYMAQQQWAPQPQMMPFTQNVTPQLDAVKVIAGNDPKMAAILSDTARTSLQRTVQFEQNGFTPEQQVQDQNQMVRLGMNNVKGRWAQLAFNTQPVMSPRGVMG